MLHGYAHHGQNEYGQDIRLFYKIDESDGESIISRAQVKSVDISSNSTDTKGNVASISNQLDIALTAEFTDDEDNTNKTIDTIILITSKRINDNAMNFLHRKYPQLTILDGLKIAELVNKYDLTEKIIGSLSSK